MIHSPCLRFLVVIVHLYREEKDIIWTAKASLVNVTRTEADLLQ